MAKENPNRSLMLGILDNMHHTSDGRLPEPRRMDSTLKYLLIYVLVLCCLSGCLYFAVRIGA